MYRGTKIVATIGPASTDFDILVRMIRAGVDIVRLNFSHGSREQHAATVRVLREVSGRLGVPIAILQDLPGPKIRIGAFQTSPVPLTIGEEFVLTTRSVSGTTHQVTVPLPNLPKDVRPGNTVLLDDGKIELRVERTNESDIVTRVVVGGLLHSGKGLNVPRVTLDIPGLTDRDLDFLRFGPRRIGVVLRHLVPIRGKRGGRFRVMGIGARGGARECQGHCDQ